ncbi:MAG: hypothetical protein ORN54_07045 [Cyclobacteriaceae bacterium]|nr:hypothetical protein [Cyclobacteriaceae bacterium]
MGWLEILSKQEYRIIGSDILVVDTLVMRDSSRIIWNQDVKENIITAKMIVVGNGCVISGLAKNGAPEKAVSVGKVRLARTGT